MRVSQLSSRISVNALSATPKYEQIYNSILSAIYNGYIKPGDSLPSINDLSYEIETSRGTIEKTYNLLKLYDVLDTVPGKGHYIKQVPTINKLKICLLFNQLSTYKKMIYDAFEEALGGNAVIDLHVYNNSFSTFESILCKNLNSYSHVVIIPPSTDGSEDLSKVIGLVPKNKLVMLDKKLPNFEGEISGAYENFEKDIYEALHEALPRLLKYKTLKLVFPKNGHYPKEIIRGFTKFCISHHYTYQIINDLNNDTLANGDLYIALKEEDLACLIEKIKNSRMVIGQDVGIISYNESPIKEFILNGITTISTDFRMLGATAARLILENSKIQVDVPFHLILRNSV